MRSHRTSASAAAGRLPARPLARLAAVCLVLASASSSFAQATPLAGLLPGTTVLALHASDLEVPRGFWDGALRAAGYENVAPILERLLTLAGESATEALGFGGELDDLKAEMLSELAADCPAAAEGMAGLVGADRWGSLVLGVSFSSFNPMPGVVMVLRPAEAELVAGVYRELVYCFASEVSLSQDGVGLDVFADGSDQPIIGALVGGDLVLATNVDLVRGAVRLANGANEPSHLRTPIGQLASNMMSGGVGLTLDLAALAQGVEGLIGMIPTGEDTAPLVRKVLASLKTVSGVAMNASFDAGGLVLNSVVTVDDGFGESELASLVLGTGEPLAPPALMPRGVSALSVGHFSLPAFVAWIDSWLAAAEPLIGERVDLRSLASSHLDVDLDGALLDWVGTTFHVAELEVPSTDLFSYLVGMEGVTTIPVRSEAAASAGIEQLASLARAALERAASLSGGLPGSELFPADPFPGDPFSADTLGWDDMVSVKPQTYRGVSYERWRVGPLTDMGLGVFGGHLVIANPAATMARVIDVYLGGSGVAADPNVGHLVTSQSPRQLGYELIDLPRYLRGFAQVADAASAPVATGVRALAREAVADGDLDVDIAELPTFSELVALGDFVANLLEALAVRTGVAVGSTEVVGSAVWSTFRVPLR